MNAEGSTEVRGGPEPRGGGHTGFQTEMWGGQGRRAVRAGKPTEAREPAGPAGGHRAGTASKAGGPSTREGAQERWRGQQAKHAAGQERAGRAQPPGQGAAWAGAAPVHSASTYQARPRFSRADRKWFSRCDLLVLPSGARTRSPWQPGTGEEGVDEGSTEGRTPADTQFWEHQRKRRKRGRSWARRPEMPWGSGDDSAVRWLISEPWRPQRD